jgi:hypothetical protein
MHVCVCRYALEPDPLARAALLANLAVNPSLLPKITVFDACISTKREQLVMAGNGQSGSALSNVNSDNFKIVWDGMG